MKSWEKTEIGTEEVYVYTYAVLLITNHELTIEADNIEALCIEILKPNSKPFAVISCYRPPNSNVDQFFNGLSTLIERLDHEDKELYILGEP